VATAVAVRRGVWPAAAAAVLVACVFVLYLVIITGQGEADVARVAFVGLMLTAAVVGCLIAAVMRDDRIRQLAAWAGVGGLMSLGVLGIFSIGLPLLVAGILMLAAAVRMGVPPSGPRAAVAACLIAAAVPWALLLFG
jgi:D-alanyl-lipoteichoic acid acyltransferase DltB (MBOAT superfamily)